MTELFKICLLGMGHTGFVFAAGLAKSGYQVCVFDFENNPGFETRKYSKSFFFISNFDKVIKASKYIFITQDIIDLTGADLRKFNKLVKMLSAFENLGQVVICSQVEVGTSRKVQQILRKKNPDLKLIYFQENLRVGEGLKPFLNPDRIVIGSDSAEVLDQFEKDFSIFKCPFLKMTLESAEMSKHALNAFLATNISFSSEIGDICELVGADLAEVTQALLADSRISNFAPIKPGIGFAGPSLKRDVKTLILVAKKHKYNPKQLRATIEVNESRLKFLINRIKNILGLIAGKQIGLLGLSYKSNSDSIKESMSVTLVKKLTILKAKVRIFDPSLAKQPEFDDLDMIILMTAWPEFKKIKPAEIGTKMKSKIIFDTRNFLDKKLYIKAGFKYYGVGYG